MKLSLYFTFFVCKKSVRIFLEMAFSYRIQPLYSLWRITLRFTAEDRRKAPDRVTETAFLIETEMLRPCRSYILASSCTRRLTVLQIQDSKFVMCYVVHSLHQSFDTSWLEGKFLVPPCNEKCRSMLINAKCWSYAIVGMIISFLFCISLV